MWIHTFPICLAVVLLALFGYLYWLRPASLIRDWTGVWAGILLWSGLRWWTAAHPAPALHLLGECVLVAVLGGLFVDAMPSDRLPATLPRPLLPWLAPTVLCLLILLLPVRWSDLPAVGFLLMLGAVSIWGRQQSLGRVVMGLSLFGWALAHDQHSGLQVTPPLLLPLSLSLLGLGMLLAVHEREIQVTEGNLIGLSMLNLPDPEIHSGQEIHQALERVAAQLEELLHTRYVALWTGAPLQAEPVRVMRGFSSRFQSFLSDDEANLLISVVARHSGILACRDLDNPLRNGLDQACAPLVAQLRQESVRGFVAILLQAKSRPMGLLIVGRSGRRGFLPAELRFLLATTNQIAVALENLRLLAESRRRSGEFEILTHIGTALSSSLDLDALLRLIHAELQKLIDVRNFYVAFQDDAREEIQFALEFEDGRVLPKRRRRTINGLTEFVIRSGKPLLVNRDLATYSQQLGIVISGRVARCWLGVPVFLQGRPGGVIAVQNFDREDAYDHEHLEILEIVAGQAAVAMDNARLFSEVQRDARQMTFLNQIARMAISTLQTQDMLQAVVDEIWKAFHYDHVGIGVINYRSRELEFRAEAGSSPESTQARTPLHVPLETGFAGKVARSGQMLVVQDTGINQNVTPLYADSRSVLVIPIIYSGQTMGVLNLESGNPYSFPPEQVLVLQTLTDQLAVAFNNALTFQQMQQQAITDGLTGLKTRRYFMEALNSEFSRARRANGSFCVLVVDMNGFKQINDNLGHLEGDLVLARVARILEQKSRASSVVARYGGDEFTILIPGANIEQGRAVAQRLQESIEQDPLMAERGASASVGVGSYPESGATPEDILRAADSRMYNAKKGIGWNSARRSERAAGGLQEKALPALYALAQSIDNRRQDPDHSLRVADYAVRVARQLRLPDDELASLQIAARLHDIGKFSFPFDLFRQGAFSASERLRTQEHPRLGAELLRMVGTMTEVADIVACHHEHLDGSGFPQGLRGEQIPAGARILAVAEEFANRMVSVPPDSDPDPRAVIQQIREAAPHAFDDQILTALAMVASEGVSAVFSE